MIALRGASTSAIVATLEPCVSELGRLDHFPTVIEIDEVVSPRAGVRFVASPPKERRRRRVREPVDPRLMYDGRITLEGLVPTRPGSAHDLWNALVWSAFPRAKRALHARQHRLIAERLEPSAKTLPGARTREQDTIAMIDEGGALLVAEPGEARTIEAALADRSAEALEAVRASFCGLVFGHAIYEELAKGPSRVLGFAVVLESEGRDGADVVARADELLAGMLSDPGRFLSPEGHRGVRIDPATFARLPNVALPSS